MRRGKYRDLSPSFCYQARGTPRREQCEKVVLGPIRINLLARDAGFAVSETRRLLSGFARHASSAALVRDGEKNSLNWMQ
jgi:hypothetical protein